MKENTGFFSNFRNYVKLPMIAMMAVSSDPEDKLKKALVVYELLKQHFFSADYLPLCVLRSRLVLRLRMEQITDRESMED